MDDLVNPLINIVFKCSSVCNKFTYTPGRECTSQQPLSDYMLWYAVFGTGEMQINEKTYLLSKGSCMLLYPGDKVSITQNPADQLTLIYNHFSVQKSDHLKPFMPPQVSFFHDTRLIEQYLDRMLEIRISSELWDEDELDYLMKLIVVLIYRLHLPGNKRPILNADQMRKMHQVADYISRHSDRQIYYKEIIELTDFSPQYLSVLFHKYSGTSLREYMTRCRMEKAKSLLCETMLNVTQVAKTLGYSDIYVFSKIFKKYVRETPSYFQQNARMPKLHK